MKRAWGLLLFVILVACSPSPVVITPTIHTVPANTSYALPGSTAVVIPTETVLHPENFSTITPIASRVEIIAPETREVKLSDLGLSDTTRLILYYQPSNSLRIMSAQDIQPKRIPNIRSNAYIWSGVQISPNQKWFLYPVAMGKRDNVAYYDFWLSSIDGKEQKLAVSNVRGATEARWATNEQIELWDYPDGSRACPKRESIVNPFTQETKIPPELPPTMRPHCFYELNTNPDHTQIIYLNGNNGLWNIYDFNTKQNKSVFPWLSESDRFDLKPNYIHWSGNNITIVLPRQDSIDFIVDLPISEVSENNIAFNKVLLPDGKKLYNETFSWFGLDQGFIGFDLVQSDFSYLEDRNESPSTMFMIFDLKHSILYNYNLDRAKTGETQKVISPFVFSSTDHRFLAWTIYDPPGMGHASETVILNRQTGRIARIKGFEFFGWGEINQP